jgi:hypothetical protein
MTRPAIGTLLAASLLLAACTSDKATTPAPAPVAPAKASARNFIPPTAEEAYRLQDDCTRRGEKILRDNIIGSALTQEQVSRYNSVTNRCYVRLDVHAWNLSDWNNYDNSSYLHDGQTAELLGFYTHKPGGQMSYLGFGCSDAACVEQKVADCMGGRECDPD